jgi:Putative bacterial sensory transduction regulator
VTAAGSADLDRLIAGVLDERELAYQHPHEGAFFVSLPGTHKLVTNTWLVVGDHSLLVEAFVVRHPDENQEAFWRYLLERNARMYGVHFSADQLGDVYLVGRVSLDAVTATELDRLLGCVLSYSDESFDTLLELGFAESIRREWKWRVSRGESLANLQAFARFADPSRRAEGAG